MKDLRDQRENYDKSILVEEHISSDPLVQFVNWYGEIETTDTLEPNCMTLSTTSKDGYPSSRIVLLKQVDTDGFVFFTNYNSDKGQEIAENSKVCLNFFWIAMQRQVIIHGTAVKIPANQSQEYYNSRPRGSQIGAWVSNQSEILSDRSILDEKQKMYEDKYEHMEEIPYPTHWGGYVVQPKRIEFWQGRPSRLHDRIRYTKVNNAWKIERVSP